MRWYSIIVMFAFVLLLFGCGTTSENSTTKNKSNENIELTKINTTQIVDQQASNQAKEILRNYSDITTVHAVNTSKILLIAIELEHSKRFSMDKTEKELKKKMKENFPNMDVAFSTDKKIILELEQLEKDIKANKVSNKTLGKRLKDIVSLSKEQT